LKKLDQNKSKEWKNDIDIYDKNDWDKDCVKAASELSVGYDLRTPEDIYLPPKCEMTLDTNFVVDVTDFNKKVFVAVFPRSSTGGDKDTHLQNTVGIIDVDYNGPKDTLKVMLRRREPAFKYIEKLSMGLYSDEFEKLLQPPFTKRESFEPEVITSKQFKQNVEAGAYNSFIKHNLNIGNSAENLKLVTTVDKGNQVDIRVYSRSPAQSNLLYKRGDRFAQMVLLRYEKGDRNFVNDLDNNNRGGLGSTGVL
jgi:dUTPase